MRMRIFAIVALVILIGLAVPTVVHAQTFTPTQTQLLQLFDKTGPFGGTGVQNSVTNDGGTGVIVNDTLGTTNGGQAVSAFDFPNPTSLAGDTSYALQFSTDATGVADFVNVKTFMQDRTTFDFIENGSAGVMLTTTPQTITINFPGGFDPTNVFEFGFQVFGSPAGAKVNVDVQPVVTPEPASLGLLGMIVPALAMRRRKA